MKKLSADEQYKKLVNKNMVKQNKNMTELIKVVERNRKTLSNDQILFLNHVVRNETKKVRDAIRLDMAVGFLATLTIASVIYFLLNI